MKKAHGHDCTAVAIHYPLPGIQAILAAREEPSYERVVSRPLERHLEATGTIHARNRKLRVSLGDKRTHTRNRLKGQKFQLRRYTRHNAP